MNWKNFYKNIDNKIDLNIYNKFQNDLIFLKFKEFLFLNKEKIYKFILN